MATSYTLSSNVSSVTEGGQVTFTITRAGDKPAETLYFSARSDGTANWSGRDFSTTTGTIPLNIPVTFAAGTTSKTVTLNITSDASSESAEQFRTIVQKNASDPASVFLAQSNFVTINDAAPTNNPPTVTIQASSSYAAGTVLTGTQLFSASDPQGSSDIDYIKVFDANVTNGAVWRYNGVVITPGGGSSGFQFEYANRGSLTYTVGTGSNDFVIEAFDDDGASGEKLHSITGTSTAPANNPPTVTIQAASSYAAGTVLTGTQLFSASDPQGSSDIDYIKLFDANVTNGAVWRYNGVVITPGGGSSGFQFEYANRGSLTYTVGTGSNDFVIEAFDDDGASGEKLHSITGTSTAPTNNPPTVTIQASSTYAAGTVLTGTQLFSASDPQGSSDIDYIKIFDANVTNGAVWRYNSAVITPGGGSAGFQFEYANRGLLTYTVGTGSNDFVIEAFDNDGASDEALHSITGTSTTPPATNHKPAAAGHNQTAAPGSQIALRDLFTFSDPDGSGDITHFAVNDRTPGGGYLVRDGVVQASNTIYERPISELDLWKFVVGNGTDQIGFNAIDHAGDYNSSVVAKVTAQNVGQPTTSDVFADGKLVTLAKFAVAAYYKADSDILFDQLQPQGWKALDGFDFYNFGSHPEASVLLAESPDGESLVVAFTGTDDDSGLFGVFNPDHKDWTDLAAHYAKFSGLLNRIDFASYDHIYITGHSMGGAMAQALKTDPRYGLANDNDAVAVAFANPGYVGGSTSQRNFTSINIFGDAIEGADARYDKVGDIYFVAHHYPVDTLPRNVELHDQHLYLALIEAGLPGLDDSIFLTQSDGKATESKINGVIDKGPNGAWTVKPLPAGSLIGPGAFVAGSTPSTPSTGSWSITSTQTAQSTPIAVLAFDPYVASAVEVGAEGTEVVVWNIAEAGANGAVKLAKLVKLTNFSELALNAGTAAFEATVKRLTGTHILDHTVFFNGGPSADKLNGAEADRRLVAEAGAGNDTLIGGSSGDQLAGGDGADDIRGGSGIDELLGSAGDDTLMGGSGKDQIDGGAGRDTADFSDMAAKVDLALKGAKAVVAKLGGKADDTIKNVEDIAGGSAGDKLTGDDGDNRLTGNAGRDTLTGGNGADWIDGGADNDSIVGGSGDDTLLGQGGNDVISGGIGSDYLSGGSGNDKLNGGAGADYFAFGITPSSANADTIADFKHDMDMVVLNSLLYTALSPGYLAAESFYSGLGAVQAHDADDRIIYNRKTGKLYYDDDGDAIGGHAPILIATLTGKPLIDEGDFLII